MQEKRFLQQNWLLSPASCGQAEAGVRQGIRAGMRRGSSAPGTLAQRGTAQHAGRRHPTATHPSSHPSAEGARDGCRSPAASLHPQNPLGSAPGSQHRAEKGATHQALCRQLRQLVHHAVRVVQDRNAAGEAEGVSCCSPDPTRPWGDAAPHLSPIHQLQQALPWVCLRQSHGQGGTTEGQSKQGPPP